MILLAMDTSGTGVTVAVHNGSGPGAAVVTERSTDDARRHAELLAPTIEEVLGQAGVVVDEVTDIAVGVGPGPFTGLRVGLVTAGVLGLALGVPVHGFCSLDALAWSVRLAEPELGAFLVATDARRREVYWAAYESHDGHAVRVEGPHVGPPAEVRTVDPDGMARPVFGHGVQLYPGALGADEPGRSDDGQRPQPQLRAGALAGLAVHRLQAGDGPFPAEPLYLRRPDAVAPGARKRVLTRGR